MPIFRKLIRNGHSTQVVVPPQVMTLFGWMPGEEMVVEACSDQSMRVRRPTLKDLTPAGAPLLTAPSNADIKL